MFYSIFLILFFPFFDKLPKLHNQILFDLGEENQSNLSHDEYV